MNFNTPPLAQIAPFDARFASQKRKYHSTKKLRNHVCQMILVCATQEFLLCSLLLLCSCFPNCCHDPFIVRNASNFSTFPRFHSVCASVSMFITINIDNCLFLFLCSECLRVCSLGATSMANIGFACSISGLQLFTRSIIDFVTLHLVVECVLIFAQFFSFLILESSS